MLEVCQLRLIVVIDEHDRLVRALRAPGIAQSTVTRGLAAVEARLRGPLSERGTVTVDLDRAVLADARGSQMRDLNSVAGSYLAETLALAAASRMMTLYPQVRLRLTSANLAEVAGALLECEAPIGLPADCG